MFSAKQSAIHPYATAADFCRIFEKGMNRLYLLSYLLTADRATAEACFERSLEDAINNNRVFCEWAESWARRTIVLNAVQMVHPQVTDSSVMRSRVEMDANEPAPIAAVLDLPAFERFVFVMSVLEGHSPQECSLMLGSSRELVTAAQFRALQQMGRNSERSPEAKRTWSDEPAPRRHDEWVPHLMVSA
jgi:DNA-directed RNA polymerase specialized sigma24 family protein